MEQQLLHAVKVVESQLDREIERLENLDDKEVEEIRRKRLEAMKNTQLQRVEWEKNGHGHFLELSDERDFFDCCKKSKHVVCHFYRESSFRCKIVDMHMEKLARQHMETKFVKINAEKVVFLVERLKIKIMPTIALIKDNKPIDYIVGFSDLGNVDEFDTEMLEWRIARADVIEYNGDLLNPPTNATRPKKHINTKSKQIIRGRQEDSGDEGNNDW
jgi:hypothetical protein